MTRVHPPLWLTVSSRFAGLAKPRARMALGLILCLMLACFTALSVPPAPSAAPSPGNPRGGQADIVLYATIVSGVRDGGNYYEETAQALREGDYPLKPFITFRLPTLAIVQAAFPPAGTIALLLMLAAAVAAVWFVRLRPAFTRTVPLIFALMMLAAGMIAFVQPALSAFHEIWAGLLIALSLALRRPGRWVEAAAIGLIAMLVRETAALYVIVMLGMAFAEGYRREAIGWGVTLIVFAGVVAAHAYAVAQVVGPLDPSSPGWTGMLGFGFYVKALVTATALTAAPLWLAAPLVALSLVGWAGWRDPLARRALWMFAAYALLLGLFGRVDNFYWGLIIAPAFLVGLAFVPDTLRDLIVAALDKRRITVTRRVQ